MNIKDQLHRKLLFDKPPKRIISLVPSQTELLFDLGLEKEVVGITKFCVHPKEWHASKVRIGGTKNINVKEIKRLKPDLIIANKEENTESEIKALMKDYPVWVSDIQNLEDALKMIQLIGEITDKSSESKKIISTIEKNFKQLKKKTSKRLAYFIWQKPMMSINKTRFIHDMISRCGFINVFADNVDAYPEISHKELALSDPEIIFLSSEPFPFNEKHKKSFKEICPDAKIFLVDGEMFSWYGSRLTNIPFYLQKLIQTIS